MTGTLSSAASKPAAVRGAGGQTARLITFENESPGDRRALRNSSYASRSIEIVFVAMLCMCARTCMPPSTGERLGRIVRRSDSGVMDVVMVAG